MKLCRGKNLRTDKNWCFMLPWVALERRKKANKETGRRWIYIFWGGGGRKRKSSPIWCLIGAREGQEPFSGSKRQKRNLLWGNRENLGRDLGVFLFKNRWFRVFPGSLLWSGLVWWSLPLLFLILNILSFGLQSCNGPPSTDYPLYNIRAIVVEIRKRFILTFVVITRDNW